MTAILQGKDRRLSLRILGYQFGDKAMANVGIDDDSWLLVEVEAQEGDLTWKRIDACLTVAEAYALARWLRGIGGSSGEATFEGIEPSLQFRAIWARDRAHLDVLFSLELHPDDAPHRHGVADPKVLRFLDLEPGMLATFATELDRELVQYPEPTPRL